MSRSSSIVRLLTSFLLLAVAGPLGAATFTSSQNGNWSASSTWGGAGVPGAGDTANVGHTVTLDVPVTVATLTLTGTITGSQSISVTTAFNWNGGTQSGPGTTTIPSGSVMTLGGYGTLDGRPLSVAGSLNMTSSYYFYIQNNASIANSGTIDFQGDGGIYVNGATGTIAITNSGTIKKSGGTFTSNLAVPLIAQNGSQFLVQSGTFNIAGVSSSGATFTPSSGATLNFNTADTRTFDATSAISGAGTVEWSAGTNGVNGTYNVTGATNNYGATTTIPSPTSTGAISVNSGTLTLNGAGTLSVPTLTISGGTLTGSAPITLTSTPMTWSGGTISGTGLLTIPAATTVTVTGTFLDGRALSNTGTIALSAGYLYMQNNATLANSGTIDFTGDGNLYMNGTVGSTAVTSSGTIRKSGGSSSSTLNVPLILQSGSQLLAQAVTLYIGPVTATGATVSVSGGASLYLYYGTASSFDATSSISGAGNVQWAAGTNTVNANYNITGVTSCNGGTTTLNNISSTGALVISSGTLTLNSGSTLTVPTLTMSGGTLHGNAPISVTAAAMNWSSGTIGGSGLVSVPVGTTISLSSLVLDGRQLSNAGTVNIVSNGNLYLQNNATVTNSGTFDIQGDGNIYLNSALGSISVTNSGTIKKSAGASSSTINVPIVLQSGSQFLLQAATLYLDAMTATSATISVSSGATLYFYYNAVHTFDAATTISGAGNVQWNSGTNTVNATWNISGTTYSSGGTTTLNNITGIAAVNVTGGALTLNGIPGIGSVSVTGGTLTLNNGTTLTFPTLTMGGGVLNGTAPISVTAASMTWSSGTIGGSGLVSIPLGTTLSLSGIILDGRQLSNAGTINIISSGSLYLQNNATVTNNGTIDLQSDGNIFLNSALGSIVLTNNGTLKKSAGTGSSTINVPIVLPSGSQFLQQAAAILYLDAVTATNATIGVSSGATLYFYYNAARSFDAATTISGAGSVQWGSGTNTVNATYNISGTTYSSGGTTTVNTITGLGAVNVTGGALTLNGVPAVGSVSVGGGTLTLNSGSTLTFPTLAITGGTLNGTAPIHVTAPSMTWSSGTIGGSSTLTIPAGTTITINSVFLDARPVTNAGTMNVVSNGYIYLQNNAVLTNNGTIDLQGDCSVYLNGVAGTTAVVNNGTIKKSAGVSGSNFTAALMAQSGSQFLVQSSIVYMDAVTSTGAAFNVSSGATLDFYYGGNRTFDATSTIGGAGTTSMQGGTATINGTISTPLNVSGGTLTINSATTQTVPTLTIAGGTLNGSGNINLTGTAMTWTGGIIGGSGTLTIPGGTIITLSGYPYFDSRPITNNGTINFTTTNYVYMQNNAVLTNNGTIDLQNDAAIYLSGVAGSTSVVNNGTIKKSGGSGTSYLLVALTAQSGSQLLIQTGTLGIGAVTATSATFNTASGTTLYFYSNDIRTFDAASPLSGAGTLNVASGTNSISGSLTLATTLVGGTLSVNSAAPQTIPSLTLNGGTLNGTDALTVSGGTVTWTAGTISGSGTFTLGPGATVNVAGYPIFDGRSVTNSGTITITSTYYPLMQNNAVLTNNGTLDFLSDGSIILNSALGTTAIVNNGLFRKSGGTGTSSVSIPVTGNAAGTLQSASGVLQFTNGVTSNGALSFLVASATAFGKMAVTGALPFAGTLAATTTGGYTPPNGTTFQVLTYGSTSGAFSQKNLSYPSGQFTDSATSTALTLTAGPATCQSAPSGIVSWWRGEGNAVDSIGVNNGTLTGGATTSIGYISSALTFNGTSAYVTVPDSATLHLTSLSVEGWVKFTTVSGAAMFLSKPVGGGTANSYQLFYDGVGHLVAAIGDGAGANAKAIGAWTPTTGLWQHVAMTFDGPTQALTIYLDGAQIGSTTTGKTPVYDANALLIGAEADPGLTLFFAGSIDELTLYNRALTGAEITSIFNSGNAGKCFSVSAPAISGFTPSNGPVGTSVTITGTNLIGTSAVSFNGTPAASYTVNSATQVTAVVAGGSTTGPISLTTAGGTAVSASSFTVGLPPADVSPSFASVPASATAGTPFNATLGATNAGANPATSVTYTVTVTGGTINSITPSGLWTSCTNSATSINCSATSLAASTTAPVGVNVTAPSAGTLTFSATTSAANDTAPGNDSGSAAVNIIPACTTPPAAITAPATACPNATGLAASVSVTAGATYAWTISNGSITAGQGTSGITFSAGASGNVILGVTVTNGTCTNSGNKSVPIATPAVPTITPSGSVTICTGNNTTLTANATGATSYAWFNNGNPLGITTPTLTVSAAGNYSVTVSYGSCSASSAQTTVTVTPPPSPTITAPANLCAGISGNASTPLIAGATYTWSVGNGTITTGQSTNAINFTAGNSGSVTLSVTVTNASNCSGSANTNVTINPAPSAAITAPAIACANTTVTASVTSQPGATYTWALAGVPIAGGQGTPSITFTAPSSGNVAIDVTVAGGGCSSHGSAVVSAAPSSLVVNAPPSVAAGSTNNVATATTIAGATYAWTITNGTITGGQSTSSVSFTAGSSGNVGLHATATVSSCSATGTATIPINALSADLGVTMTAAPSPVAPGGPVTFTVTVTNHGPGDASGVTVTTALPSPASSVTPSSPSFTCSGTTNVTCSASSLVNGAAATISISVNAPLTGTSISGTATVSASTADANSANNSASAGVTIGQTTCGTTPAALLAPADGATTTSPVTFSWSAVDNASAYEVWASADGAPASLAGTTSSTSLTAAVSGNAVDWYVATRFDNGCPTLLSSHRSFHVTAATSCQNHVAPLLTSPLSGSIASPVTFSWQGSPEAVGYEVWITVDGAAAQDVGTTSGATTLTASVPPGNIGWFVDALFAGCPLLRSGTAFFNVPKPDPCAGRAAAQLLAPADNSTHPSSGVDFQWTAAANANGYRLWTAIDGAPFAALGTTNDTSLHASIPSGSVAWYVEALFNGCASTESQHRTFVIPNGANCGNNGQAANLSPQTDTANPSVTFSWSAVPNATGYELWLALGQGSPALLGITTSTSLTHDVPAGALEWFVRAHFDGCPNTESQHAHFSYVPAAQCSDARPLLVAPLDGMTGVYAPVSFSWKSVAGVTSYKLWLSNNEGAYAAFATTPAAHLDDAAVPTGTIDWYVEALTNGCPSTVSTPSRFTVVTKPSGCPALTPPVLIAPGAASSGVQYTVRWQRVAGATSYVVESAGDLVFSTPAFVSTDDDHYDFTNTNDGNTPQSMFFRVRALATCQAQPGPYSTAVAVVILPSHPPSHTATSNLQGAISADTAQTITYTIPLDASLAGLAFVATPNQSFLTVTPSSGIVPAGGMNLTVTADTSHLAIGTTLGGITITTSAPSSSGHLTANGASSGTTTISVSLVSPAQPTPKNTPPPDALIIPAVAHAGGINSTFQSDVRVTNSSPQVMKYQVTFTPSGDSGLTDSKQATIDINPGNTIALDDILGTWFSNTAGSAIGTLEIRPLTTQSTTSTPASVTAAGLNAISTFASSRTFNVTTNGTFGQYIPAIPFGSFIGLSKDPKVPSILSLQQIAQSSAFRTNLGLVEGSGQAASVLISVFGGNGSKVAEFPLDLAGGQHTQFSLASKNISNLTDGRVEVKVLTPGGKVTAYASVLDNLTSDPLLVSPVNLSAAGSSTYVVPGVANLSTGFANWRTDLRLFNATSSAVDATLTYYSQGGGDPKSVTVTLAPNEVKALDDTLANTFGVTNDGGAVHITTAAATNLIATARTYNQTRNGTFGQFIPAVTPQDAIGVGSRPLQVLQLEESDRYRSNIGLAEVTGKPATVLLSVVLPDSKVSGNVQIDLAPNEFRQFNSLLKSFGTGTLYNARIAVKVISGEGRVTAYASVIDALTQDPTYVPAQ